MNAYIVHRILDIQDKLRQDSAYSQLMQDYEEQNDKLLKMLSTLSYEQRKIIINYISMGISLHLQMLEIACKNFKTD